LLRQVDEKHDHVRYTFPSDGGGGDQRDVPSKALVLIVEASVQTLLCKGKDGLRHAILEFALYRTILFGQ